MYSRLCGPPPCPCCRRSSCTAFRRRLLCFRPPRAVLPRSWKTLPFRCRMYQGSLPRRAPVSSQNLRAALFCPPALRLQEARPLPGFPGRSQALYGWVSRCFFRSPYPSWLRLRTAGGILPISRYRRFPGRLLKPAMPCHSKEAGCARSPSEA